MLSCLWMAETGYRDGNPWDANAGDGVVRWDLTGQFAGQVHGDRHLASQGIPGHPTRRKTGRLSSFRTTQLTVAPGASVWYTVGVDETRGHSRVKSGRRSPR